MVRRGYRAGHGTPATRPAQPHRGKADYFALSLTDPALATAPLVKNTNAVIDVVAAQLRTSQAADDTPAWTRTRRPSACSPCLRAWATASWPTSPRPGELRPSSTTT
jgi:hypothetical protein